MQHLELNHDLKKDLEKKLIERPGVVDGDIFSSCHLVEAANSGDRDRAGKAAATAHLMDFPSR
jgi:hypothetical protein